MSRSMSLRHHHLTSVHVTPLRYAHSLFLGEVTNRVNERSGVTWRVMVTWRRLTCP